MRSFFSTTVVAIAATLFLSLFMIGIFRQVAYAAGKEDAFRLGFADTHSSTRQDDSLDLQIPPPDISLKPSFISNSFFGWRADSFSSSSGIRSSYPGLQHVQSFVIHSPDDAKAVWVEEYGIADRADLNSYLESRAIKASLEGRDVHYINSLGERADSALLLPGDSRALLIHSRIHDGSGWPVEADPELTALMKRIVIP